jgi:hypothetical protein
MSLTPESRKDEAVQASHNEGVFNAACTLIPSIGAMALALRHPTFLARTNWQSRTAITITPACFVYFLTSEHKLSHKMREIAQETQHSTATVQWAEDQWKEEVARRQRLANEQQQQQQLSESQHITALYRQSLASTGVCVVPELHWYHTAANYTAANPIKVLAAIAVPAVGWIFYGRSDQKHLQFSSKIMHTRVFGQFATISALLGIMGFKEWIDHNGRFISQEQADQRIAEMQRVRLQLKERLQEEEKLADEAKREIAAAHEQDVEDKKKKRKENKNSIESSATAEPMALAPKS